MSTTTCTAAIRETAPEIILFAGIYLGFNLSSPDSPYRRLINQPRQLLRRNIEPSGKTCGPPTLISLARSASTIARFCPNPNVVETHKVSGQNPTRKLSYRMEGSLADRFTGPARPPLRPR
jgi:hypothetical protein